MRKGGVHNNKQPFFELDIQEYGKNIFAFYYDIPNTFYNVGNFKRRKPFLLFSV